MALVPPLGKQEFGAANYGMHSSKGEAAPTAVCRIPTFVDFLSALYPNGLQYYSTGSFIDWRSHGFSMGNHSKLNHNLSMLSYQQVTIAATVSQVHTLEQLTSH